MVHAKGKNIGNHNLTLLDLFKNMGKKGSKEMNLNLTRDDRYKFKKILGIGATGLVYKAWDRRLKRYVAAKVSKKRTNNFVPETRLMGRLEHNNIAAIYDANSGLDISYIIMEYIQGTTLSAFCNKDNLLPLQRVSEIIIEVCKGLHYAHSNGVIHRDIKPSNIILNKQGIPKIMDFGISQMVGKTQPMGLCGTPSYMSPEQLKGEIATNISDIFSLGCVLYELLEGQKAFGGENPYTIIYKVINHDPAPLSMPQPQFKPIFEKIIRKALAKKPEDRYKSCHDLAYDLNRTLVYLNSQKQAKKSTTLPSVINRIKEGLKISNPPGVQ